MRANPRTKRLLESAYSSFHSHFYRDRDPVAHVHRYRNPRDQEVAALFSACLAYGNVATILSSVDRVLASLGPSPYNTLVDGAFTTRFSGFRHRFTTDEDIEILCEWIAGALRSHGSLQEFFVQSGSSVDAPMRLKLSAFVRRLTTQPVSARLNTAFRRRKRNLMYLVSDPERGSACKRLNLFLRWMVRKDDGIDLGLWNRISTSELMLPVDTHLMKTLLALKWTSGKSATWRTVEAATARLRLYAPDDPVRYDFALCHLSMEGNHVFDLQEE